MNYDALPQLPWHEVFALFRMSTNRADSKILLQELSKRQSIF